jgi:hypothetical protein
MSMFLRVALSRLALAKMPPAVSLLLPEGSLESKAVRRVCYRGAVWKLSPL